MKKRELDSYIEVVSDISMEIGATMYCSGKNSVEVKGDIRAWADEFMDIHKQTDWREVDYLEQVLDFTHKKINAEIQKACESEKLSAGEYIIRKCPDTGCLVLALYRGEDDCLCIHQGSKGREDNDIADWISGKLDAPQIENAIRPASEDALDLDKILVSDDDCEAFAELVLGEIRGDDDILSSTGNNLISAYLNGDCNGIILALSGWRMETLVRHYNEQKKEESKDEKSQVPKLKCPQCGAEVIFNETTGRYACESCGLQWDNDSYVLVGYNEIDAFEDEDTEEARIGYASYASEDNSARYIPFNEYIKRLGKIPNITECYQVVTWPESQMLMEASDFEEECEAIFDEVGLEAFGGSACWAPLNWLKSFNENQK